MDIDSKIDKIAHQLSHLTKFLNNSDYLFKYPDEVFPGIEKDVENSISLIEQESGTIPLAIKLFWRKVGSINLCGKHPDWLGCDYPDPLVVYPASYAVVELQEFIDDKEYRLRHDYPYVIPIAPDYFHKSDVSGGMCYNVSVPAVADDPPLNDEYHNFSFID